MEYTQSFLITLIFTALLCSCHGGTSQSAHFSNKVYEPKYASGFEILSSDAGESTMIISRNPWQGAEEVATQLLIQRNGESIPEGFTGQVLTKIPEKIVCLSSTHVGMLDELGLADRITGVSGAEYITNASVKSRKPLFDVGYEGAYDYEQLAAAHPDLVLLYGVDGASPLEPKLREMKIPFIYIGDYLEQDPLGKAEWMVVISELFGKRDLGTEKFLGIADNYNQLKEKLAKSGRKKKVMLNTPYADSWVMPDRDNYTVRLIRDAGGAYLYEKNASGKSQPIDLEEALAMASEADVWINVGTARSLQQLSKMCPKFVNTNLVTNRQVWNNTKRTNASGGNDYWESGIAHPDLILKDLATILNADDDALAEDSLIYYERLK